jgi:hypothetical protein
MQTRHLLPLLVLALVATTDASAQYQWRDAEGRMVFSDLPPPPSVAPAAVLKAPVRVAPPETTPGAAVSSNASSAPAVSSASAAPPSASAAPPSAADREMEFRKRRLERAEAEKKAAEAEARSQRAQQACTETRGEIRNLESGARISRMNERGEREFLDDAQRAARLESARKSMQDACKAS